MQYKIYTIAEKLLVSIWGLSSLCYFLLLLTAGPSKVISSFSRFDLFSCFSYVFFCVALMYIGISLAHQPSLKRLPISSLISPYFDSSGSSSLKPSFTLKNSVLYIIAGLALVSGIVSFRSSGFTGDLEAQRRAYISATQETSITSYISQFSQSAVAISTILIPWAKGLSITAKIILISGNFIACLLFSLSSAGRVTIFLCFLLPLIFSLFVGNQFAIFNSANLKERLKIIFPLLFTVILIVCLFAAINYYRNESYVEIAFGQTIKPYASFFNSIGIEGDLSIIFSFSIFSTIDYLSNGLQYFPHFFEIYTPHPLMGAYQFNFISSRFPGYDWFLWKQEVENSYRYYGLYWNVWGSYARDYVVDFGKEFAPFFSLFTGFLIGFVEKRAMNQATFYALYVLLLCWLMMSPYYSLFVFRPFQISIISLFSFLCLKLIYK